MVRRVQSRAGVTLLEVLVAIFVMAIGMLAIFTLFPLGAINMAQAIKDDRTRQTADQADAFMRMYWLNSVLTGQDVPLVNSFSDPLTPPPNPPWGPLGTPPHRAFLPHPGATVLTTYPPVPTAAVPSYPVLVDPLGLFARGDAGQFWTAWTTSTPGTTPLIPRRNLSIAINQTNFNRTAIETCCLLDDMTFQENGAPDPGLLRQGRYTWAAMVQRPRNNEPSTANLTVLVFEGRPPLLATPGDEVVVNQSWVGAPDVNLPTITPIPLALNPLSPRTLSILVPNRSTEQTPLIRKGGWIMDGTIDTTNPAAPVRNAIFYRIAGVTEGQPGPNGTPFTLDLQSELKPTSATPRFYLFAGLSEVFERPPLLGPMAR